MRAADWVGPTSNARPRPQTQKATGPDDTSRAVPTTISALSEPTITGLAPMRSSSRPPSSAPQAATVDPITPKIRTSPDEIP